MKKYIEKHLRDFALSSLFFIFLIVSNLAGYAAGREIGRNFSLFFTEMIVFLPFMFIIIGLFDVWFPKEKLEKYIGRDSGIRGIIWVILLAMIQAGPLYGAFPVAALLWKKGAGTRNVFIYLGAFSSLKIPMLAFETGFLGLKFTLLRSVVTLPLFIIVGIVMEYLLRNSDFKVIDPAAEKEQ